MRKLMLLAVALFGCHNNPEAGTPQLRSYAVPGRTAELRSALSSLFSKRDDARAEIAPDGSLLVLAPATVQAGVASVVSELAARPSAPQSVHVSYWFVLGKKGQSALPHELVEVMAALDEAQKALGPQTFTLLERVDMSSASGEVGEVNGREARVKQNLAWTGSALRGRLELHALERQNLQTNVELQPGRVLILAESGVEKVDGTLYYLVRADLAK